MADCFSVISFILTYKGDDYNLLLTENISIKITKQNIDWFQSKNYSCELKDIIDVNIFDLQKNSTKMVKYKCDNCFNIKETPYRVYIKHKFDQDYCPDCQRSLYFANKKFEYEYVKNFIENESDCKLISDTYINNSTHILLQCACGEIFETTFSIFKDCNKKQCNKCGVLRRSGENSYLWKGGITPINKLIRKNSEYFNWRKSVFERDNYTCQCCGKIGVNLNAHHIKNFSNNINLRFDINNGITLCKNCHSQIVYGSFHEIFGTYYNNERQLNEYIEGFRNGNIIKNKKNSTIHYLFGEINNYLLESKNNVINLKDYLKQFDGQEIEILISKR